MTDVALTLDSVEVVEAHPNDRVTGDLVNDARYFLAAFARNDLGKNNNSADHAKGNNSAAIAADDVRTMEAVIGDYDAHGGLSAAAKGDLSLALNRALLAIAPVTIQTLRDTDTENVRTAGWWSLGRFATYEARWLSRKMIAFTIFFSFIAVGGDVYLRYYGPPLDQTDGFGNLLGILLQVFTPFTYGAIGACVYLLRSLHIYVYQRTYDCRRNAEYGNRVLLGMVSGGAVVLLVDQVTGDNGATIRFSSAALGFLTGYNTDFLFSTIERVTAAILPKITLESLKRADGGGPSGGAKAAPSYAELFELFKNAKTDDEKAILKDAMNRLIPKTNP